LAKPLEQPLRVVLDSALRAPSNRQIFSDHTLVVHGLGEGASYAETTPGAVEYLPLAGGPRNLAGLLEVLAQRGCNNVLVEAGPKILGSFLHAAQEAPLWDEWICYIAPMAMGSATLPLAEFALPHLADAQRAKVVEHRMIGEDLQLRLQPAQ
jgi:diaminohydroxyphosphoribosylaminopyrimidine deaminase/5-amino-6-(5-phosphoribosylamino)uracil reductase